MASGIMYAAGRNRFPLAPGFMTLIVFVAPLTYPVAARFPRHRRKALLLGFLLIFVSLFGASYARTVGSRPTTPSYFLPGSRYLHC